ncbi:MAG: amidohydrolase family protein, partial [Oligoflexia bacterium]|nr:amidohydrolase family protein [Oligoflexia bacterium]
LASPHDIERMRASSIIPSIQPLHCPLQRPAESDSWLAGVGEQRLPFCYAWRSLKLSQVPIAFGSDWPVVSYEPMQTIKSAMQRSDWCDAGKPAEFSLDECVRAYTYAGAFAEFQETQKGMLRPGMLADMVVMDCCLHRQAPQGISRATVTHTVLGGKVIFSSAGVK